MKNNIAVIGFALLGVVLPASAFQYATDDALALKQANFIEFGASYDRLSGGFGSWNSQFVRFNQAISPRDRLDGEIASQKHFGSRGTLLSVGITHTFNDDWYGRLALGTSSGGFFLPDWRVDASLSRKWLAQRNLVTTLGLGYYNAKDEHSDKSVLLSMLYYFQSPFILELGARLNRSDPGSVDTERLFGALTWGQNKQRFVTLKYETGEEGYQLLDGDREINNFDSEETTLIWRQWLKPEYGFNVRLQHYSNPSYDRDGVELSVFLDF